LSFSRNLHLESLEVGAAPLVRLFLERLDLPRLFERYLPALPGRAPVLASATVLGVLLTNLLLALSAVSGMIAASRFSIGKRPLARFDAIPGIAIRSSAAGHLDAI